MTPVVVVPQRGDAVIIDFNPQQGREQAGRRPAVVLSPSVYNERVGLAIVCPITSQVKGYPFEVGIPAGLAVSGVILSDHVKSLDWRMRNAHVVGRIPSEIVDDVLQKLDTLLGKVSRL